MLFTSQESNEVLISIYENFSSLLSTSDLDLIFRQSTSFENFIDISQIVRFLFYLMNKRWNSTTLFSKESMFDLHYSSYQDLCALPFQYDLGSRSHGLDLDEKLF